MYLDAGNNNKGIYVGYSQGSIQMLVALTKFESELMQYLEKSVFLTPCTGFEQEPDLSEESMNEVSYLRKTLGI